MKLLNKSTVIDAHSDEKDGLESQINLYKDVPSYTLSLDELEVFALNRLKVRFACAGVLANKWCDANTLLLLSSLYNSFFAE
jgi:hypothetical protein